LTAGFDHFFGLLHNLDPVETVYFENEGGVPLRRRETVVKRPADPAELTRHNTDEAIAFIEQQQQAGKPFCWCPPAEGQGTRWSALTRTISCCQRPRIASSFAACAGSAARLVISCGSWRKS
jgi:hypothetical protein